MKEFPNKYPSEYSVRFTKPSSKEEIHMDGHYLIVEGELQDKTPEKITSIAQKIILQLVKERYPLSDFYDSSFSIEEQIERIYDKVLSINVFIDKSSMRDYVLKEFGRESSEYELVKTRMSKDASVAYSTHYQSGFSRYFIYAHNGEEDSLLHECSHVADRMLKLHQDNNKGHKAVRRSNTAFLLAFVSTVGVASLAINSATSQNNTLVLGMSLISLLSLAESTVAFSAYKNLESERVARKTEKRLKTR